MTNLNTQVSTQKPVITRFAPSPTGYLHIGGARTALFNWLYARHTGGKFLIRIEDTDTERSTIQAVDAIFEGLDWLGLKPDNDVIFQSKRKARHKQVVTQLLELGKAYACFMTADETQDARNLAQENGHALRSIWRDITPSAQQLEQPHVIRFKGPLDQVLVVKDAVQGDVSFNTKTLDDLVLLRSDKTPTYNLAVVVDDHDMGITHIIRGDDHLNNAARQSLIYQALDWDLPVFAHIPLIHGPDGAKLSKRHGAQAVGDFKALGYLPEAMRNYLARLGWSHLDDEIFNDAQAIEWFDIIDINKAAARLDFTKLGHINAHWIRVCDPMRLVELVFDQIKTTHPQDDLINEGELKAVLSKCLPMVKERAHTLIDLGDLCKFAFAKQAKPLDEKSKKLLDHTTIERLKRLYDILVLHELWDDISLDILLKQFSESQGIGFGKIGPALRTILSFGHPAPDISKTLSALGQNESLNRLKNTLFI